MDSQYIDLTLDEIRFNKIIISIKSNNNINVVCI